MMRRTLLATPVVLFAGALAPAMPSAAGADPAAFITNLGNQLRVLVGNTSPEQRLAGFRELFREDFDVPGLGRFVVGRYWWALTPSQQQEFLGLFENYVVLTYSDRLSEFANSGDLLKVTGSRADPDGAFVSSEIIRGAERDQMAQPIKVDWRLTGRDGIYKISDIVIAGLSMAVNGRSQLEGVVERNGGRAQAILAVMRQESANVAICWSENGRISCR